jgi:uncharacterized protein with HEPN domain
MKNSHLDSQHRLQHIEEAINKILNFTQGLNAESFISDELVHYAVLFQFSVIGEAIINIEADILAKYSYPWHRARAFRNLIAHEYFNIKLIAVWEIIQTDLPNLKTTIQEILENEF